MPPRDTLADSLVYVSHGTAAEGPRKADHEGSGARTARIHGRRRAPGTPALSLFFFFSFSFLLTRRTLKKGTTLQKGGVPAAPSGTATLLRLSPNHQFYPRPPLTPGFHGLTGGVYKARERIHRAMADARLLANPASRSRVADSGPNWGALSGSAPRRRVASLCMPHCNTCVAPDVRAVLI